MRATHRPEAMNETPISKDGEQWRRNRTETNSWSPRGQRRDREKGGDQELRVR
jgi:hypothetical protein